MKSAVLTCLADRVSNAWTAGMILLAGGLAIFTLGKTLELFAPLITCTFIAALTTKAWQRGAKDGLLAGAGIVLYLLSWFVPGSLGYSFGISIALTCLGFLLWSLASILRPLWEFSEKKRGAT